MRSEHISLELSEEAEQDFDQSFEFYFEDNSEVADSFYQQIKYSFEKINKPI